MLQAALFLNTECVARVYLYKLRMSRYRVMPSIQEGDDENYEELTFPALFRGLITMVQRLGTSGELEIRLLKGEDILRACKEFFDEDQTGRACLGMLNAAFPDQHFLPTVFRVDIEGHFDLVFVGGTMELRMRSYMLVDRAYFCVDLRLILSGPGSACCVVG